MVKKIFNTILTIGFWSCWICLVYAAPIVCISLVLIVAAKAALRKTK